MGHDDVRGVADSREGHEQVSKAWHSGLWSDTPSSPSNPLTAATRTYSRAGYRGKPFDTPATVARGRA